MRFDMRDFRGSGQKAAIRTREQGRGPTDRERHGEARARRRGRIDTSASPPCQRNAARDIRPLQGISQRDFCLSPAPTDPDAHEVCACLAHLHRRVDPTFTRAPKLARQADFQRQGSANPLGPYAPARPGPKRGDLSCDPNWIHPSSPRPPVDLEPALRSPIHRKPSKIPSAYKFLLAPILSPAAQPE